MTHLGLQRNSIVDVSPLATLVNLTWLRLAGNSITDFSALVTLAKVTDSDVDLPDPDTTAPGVSISVPSGVQTGVFSVTITFTESVSDFVQADLGLSGAASVTGWHANGDNTVYTATITPTASGTVTVSVAANVATDAANNPNTAATSQTVTVDIDRPTVSIGVPSGVQNGAFDATIAFSETVSGFTQSDVSLSGSAASLTDWYANNDNTIYTATITPTDSGTVAVSVAANVATDAANNLNTAATPQTVSVDVDPPSVSISVPLGVQTGAFDAVITFSETVSGFAASDVSVSGSATATRASWYTTDDITYTAEITPTTNGQVTLNVDAGVVMDAANNPNTAAIAQTVTVEIPSSIPDPATWMPDANLRSAIRNALGLATDATFTQAQLQQLTELWASQNGISDITGLKYATGLTTLSLWGNSISDLTPLSGLTGLTDLRLRRNQIVDVTPLQNLTNLTRLRLGRNPGITDFSPLSGLKANLVDYDVDIPDPDPEDTTSPSVEITVPSDLQNGAFDATMTFSETVSGFVQADLTLSGTSAASITAWDTTDNITYTAEITPATDGSVTLSVAAGVATDAANNANTAATSQTVAVDVDPPVVSVAVPSSVQTSAFYVTITFTETVSGFVPSDLSLSGTATATITAWATTDDTTYTAMIAPATSGEIALNVAAGVATDTAGNTNTAASTQTVSVDIDPPGVSIAAPSGVQTGAFDVTITFTEPVLDFEQSDVSLTGTAASAITVWSANTENTIYTATITPTTTGEVILSVDADVATDAGGNPNTAATVQSVLVDVGVPGVSISVPEDIQNSAFEAFIIFTEVVSDFVQGDLLLEHNTAGATITAWETTDNIIYTVTITSTSSGGVTLRVPASVATDAESNPNTAAPSQRVNVDVDEPTVSLSVPSNVQNGRFTVQVNFSEPVSGFLSGTYISLVNNTATATVGAYSYNLDGTTFYNVSLTPTTSGSVTLNIPAGVVTDAAKNPNTASETKTVVVDMDAPGVSISGFPSGVQTGAFDVTITFTEPVLDFEQSDVSLTGTAASAITVWSANTENTIYTATITPMASGEVMLGVDANVATDVGGNSNTVATAQSVLVDTGSPGVSIAVPEDIQNSAFEAFITFTEVVSDFVQGDLLLEHNTAGAMITAWNTTDNIIYTATITPTSSGGVTLRVPASVATDAAKNPNTASETKTVVVDMDAPGVSISGFPSGVQTGAFDVTITFTEPVLDFEQSDVSLTGTATAIITAWDTTDNTVYTATITPMTSGEVMLGVDADVATDAGGNPNTVATAQSVPVDTGSPGVSIAVSEDIQNSAFEAFITFTEVVSDFVQADLLLEHNTAGATITAWETTDNIIYTATITSTSSGGVTLRVPASVATDAESNPNTAASSQRVNVDVDEPTVSLSVPSDVQNGRFTVQVNFSEPVSGFSPSDIFFVNNTANVSSDGYSYNSDGTFYGVSLTPTTSGSVTLNIPAGVVTDAAKNPNTVSETKTVVVDMDAPGVSISGFPSGVQIGAFNATFTFTEPVLDFEQSDVSLTGTVTAIVTEWEPVDDTTYTATITPISSGIVIVNVPADVATDVVGNPNTAAASQSVIAGRIGDTQRPTVSIAVLGGIQSGTFDAKIMFSESVLDFEQSDVSLTGTANASIAAWFANPVNTVYTATVTSTMSGEVTLGVAADVATDVPGNGNTAATPVTVDVDVDGPDVAITVPEGVQSDPFDVTITFTEAVSGFVQGDVRLGAGTARATITAWETTDNITYTAEITPTASGQLTIRIPRGIATDAVGNPNTEAIQMVDVDIGRPGVSLSVDLEEDIGDYVTNGPFEMTITFTEPVSGFEQSDIVFSRNDAGATITDFQTIDAQTYTVDINPSEDLQLQTDDYEVRLYVPAGAAMGAADNPNTAARSPTVKIDIERPTALIPLFQDQKRNLLLSSSSVETETFTIEVWFLENRNGYFPERVSGFEQSDLSLTNNTAGATITGWSEGDGASVGYIPGATDAIFFFAEITATQSGSVTFSVPENVVTDKAGNSNKASTPKTVTITLPGSDPPEVPEDLDTTSPGVSIAVDSEWQNGPFEMTITFTEPVSGFERSDVVFSRNDAGATITDFQTIDAQTYTVDITPSAGLRLQSHDYEVRLLVPVGVATDTANNLNTEARSPTVKIDIHRPNTWIMNAPSNVETETFTIDIWFMETTRGNRRERVSGFNQSDLSLTNNTAGATITGWSSSESYYNSLVFTAEITATQSGSVTFNVAEGVATDLAGNENRASNLKTVTITLPGSDPPDVPDVDTTLPGVSIAVDSEWQNGPFEMTITFTEPVSGFERSDVVFSRNDAGATITDFQTIDAQTYTVDITPSAGLRLQSDDYEVRLLVPVGVATDTANNPNTETRSPTVKIDIHRPDIWIMGVPVLGESSGITRFVNSVETETFTVEIWFIETTRGNRRERVSGFNQSDLSLTSNTAGATITGWSSSESYYNSLVFTAEITATQSGSVTFGVAEGVATDLAGNLNTAAIPQTVNVNLDQLNVSLTVPSDVQNGVFAVITTFTGTVSDFEQSDLSLTNNTAGAAITDWVAGSDQKTYTAVITPTTSGSVTFSVAENVATNVANNPNTASGTETVSVDMDAPGVSVSAPSGVQNGAFDATITFTEAVSDFEQADVSLSGTATATITHWNTTDDTIYTATITPTTSGKVTLNVAADVATDAANNQNTAAISQTVTVDVDAPGVSISAPSDVQNGAFDATITFTEAVSDFEQADASLSGTATATITNWSANADNTVYTATITPTTSGSVDINIAADVATDAAGNSNTAATAQTVTVNLDLPAWDVNTDGNVDAADVALINAALGQTGAAIANPRTDVNGDGTVDDADVLLVLENFASPPWDINEDGSVDITDVLLVALALGQSGDDIVNSRTDVNMNGTVDSTDLLLVAGHLDANNAAPMSSGLLTLPDRATLETLDIVPLEVQLDILRSQSDGSPKYLLAITLLESLLEAMRPKQTLLLANYPNPFNPETWIPYHLANAGDVQITIYDMRGTVIRRLALGHQREGYYTSRGRAAHWDGRNNLGERVASGIYFYQLQMDNMSLLRKMLILK